MITAGSKQKEPKVNRDPTSMKAPVARTKQASSFESPSWREPKNYGK